MSAAESLTEEESEYNQYFYQIAQIPLLSREEERELAMGIARGSEADLWQMVIANLRLVVSIAREYAGRGAVLSDLIQEGTIGLMTAARKFDYTREYRFSTYASKWVRQAITRYLIDRNDMIRVPMHTAERIGRIRKAKAEFEARENREPDIRELSALVGLPEEKVEELLRLSPEVSSLDLPATERDSLAEKVEDWSAPDPEDAMMRMELTGILHGLLASLNERQRMIIIMHYGLWDSRIYSLEEISRSLGISKERTRQIERQALDKLLALGSNVGLEDFLK